MIRKLLFAFITICLSSVYSFAQMHLAHNPSKDNLVKLNLFALGLKTVSLQYERPVGKRISVAMGLRYMPESSIPLKSSFTSLADDDEFERQIDGFKTGNIAITPEFRYYVGKKGATHGFYIAPFARYTNFTAKLPYEYDVEGVTQTINLSGNLNTYTGGIMFGAQWKLSNLIYLDWWIFGPQYGASGGKIDGKKTLLPEEQDALRESLADLDVPLTNTSYTVDGNGAQLKFNGPWGGLRSGLAIGFRF